jgi:hypothetical protein
VAKYRAVAKYAARLMQEPEGIEDMTLNAALRYVQVYKDAQADTTDADLSSEEPSQGRVETHKRLAAPVIAMRKAKRLADQFVGVVRENRYGPDIEELEEIFDGMVASVRRIFARSVDRPTEDD